MQVNLRLSSQCLETATASSMSVGMNVPVIDKGTAGSKAYKDIIIVVILQLWHLPSPEESMNNRGGDHRSEKNREEEIQQR